jgi:hypothetical protein
VRLGLSDAAAGTAAVGEFRFAEEGIVRNWIIVRHEFKNKLSRLDSQGMSPNKVSVRRDTASPQFQRRNKRMVLGAHLAG